MADSVGIFAQATADLQRAEREVIIASERLARATGEVAELRNFLSTLERYATPNRNGRLADAATEHVRNIKVPLREGTMGRQLVDACIDAITAAGKPLPIGDLLDWVLSEGLTVGGTDQKSNLAGYLSRDPRMESLGRTVGWAVVKTEGAALEPASGETAPLTNEGGTDDRSTLASSGFDDLLGSQRPQVP